MIPAQAFKKYKKQVYVFHFSGSIRYSPLIWINKNWQYVTKFVASSFITIPK